VCLSVCLSDRISPEPHARYLPFFVYLAYGRGSALLRHVDDRPHRLSAGRGDGSAQHGRSVGLICDCFVLFIGSVLQIKLAIRQLLGACLGSIN